jgi:8-oxo-dGTP pyrophosphatase MutT (NUDIX family)
VPIASVERLRSRIGARLRRGIDVESARRAAVLVLVVGREEPLELVLFERTLEVAHHKGEICFPGGSIEPGDADAVSAALREACEELGVPAADVLVLGCLDDVHTLSSNYVITPVVGYLEAMPVLVPDPSEVARTIVLGLDELSAPGAWTVESIVVRGAPRDVETFKIGAARIWGATARILQSFLAEWHSHTAP